MIASVGLLAASAAGIAACQGSSFSSGPTAAEDAGSPSRDTGTNQSDDDSGSQTIEGEDAASAIEDAGSNTVRCNPATPFGAPTRVAGLPEAAVGFRLSPNELSGFFHVDSQATPLIFRITRNNRLDNFEPSSVKTVTIQQPALQADASAPYFYYATVTNNESRMYVMSDYSIYVATRVSDGVYGQLTKLLTANSPAYSFYTIPYATPADDALYFSTVLFASGTNHVITVNGSSVSSQVPVDLGTKDGNRALVVTADGTLAYFSSWRELDGATFYQVWTASRTSTAVPFTNLQPVVELRDLTSNNDPTYISNDGCRLYFQSNRKGSMNTYLAERSPL